MHGCRSCKAKGLPLCAASYLHKHTAQHACPPHQMWCEAAMATPRQATCQQPGLVASLVGKQ